ncbi:MAG: hypothetical protein ACRD3S_07125, partial [Terracidiphilus sp.]
MGRFRLFAALLCGTAFACVVAHSQTEPAAPLVLEGGTVIDVSNWGHSARDLHDAVVIIEADKITA